MRGRTLLAAVAGFGLVTGAWATEGGGGAYPNGAEDFMIGALPPPGNYFIDYVMYYSADELMGDDGKNMMPGFDLKVWGNIVRYVHVSKTTILGASWAQHVFVPVVNVDVTIPNSEVDTNTIPASTNTVLVNNSRTGVGDIIVDPIILGWHFPNCHVVAGVDVFVPVGAYDEDDPSSVGRNCWTFEPVLAVTCAKGGYEASAKVMYDVNLENKKTKVRSGDELHVDASLGMRVAKCSFGVVGYYYQQVTEDNYPVDFKGPQFEKGKTIAAGPQVALQMGKTSLVLKYEKEFGTENRPEGQKAWLKFVLPL